MKEIVAGCFQFDVLPADPEGNMRKVEEALGWFAGAGCRLLVLPEMWSCDFVYPRLREMAEETPRVLDVVRSWSRRYGMVLVGSLPELHGESVFNTSYVVDASGEVIGAYRKVHLFSLHGEDAHFSRGERTVLCRTEAGSIGVIICYDLRFPELSRRLALDGAQILCVSALWPTVRVEHWSLLLRCRAIENQLFVIGCNGTGEGGNMKYGGASAVISPTGSVLAKAGEDEEKIVAVLRLEEITRCRELIPCFADRRPDAYDLS